MFVRRKKNPSGVTSVQVIDKSSGKYCVVKTIGSSSVDSIILDLIKIGNDWIKEQQGLGDLFEAYHAEKEEINLTEHLLSKIDNILINGTQLILEKVYKSIGFDKLNDDILKFLVIARLSNPLSKSGTVDYLKSYYDQDIKLHKIYRYLDKLDDTQQEAIQTISVAHTRSILGGNIGLLFYDVTTLYFETDYGDGFRENGFSKDGKHSQPQVVLGLLVSKEGYPLSYSIFNGSQYEGRTMLPVVEDFVSKFKLEDFIIVADSGLLSKKNIKLLEAFGHKYILGARIKNENENVKQWLLSLEKSDGIFYEKQKSKTERLIINYSAKRAKKDSYNREKGVKRLEKEFKSGNVTKEHINKKGYNKFLELSDNVSVEISKMKIIEDQKWDGLKGYITNTNLNPKDVYEHYNGLWVIENAFRVTKSNIEIRPMFHFTESRIHAHVCICFLAYKVYKELERVLKIKKIELNVDKVLSIAKTITTLKIKILNGKKTVYKTMILTKQQKEIENLFNHKFWENI